MGVVVVVVVAVVVVVVVVAAIREQRNGEGMAAVRARGRGGCRNERTALNVARRPG